MALVLYLLSIWALLHGYRTAQDVTERNQVKWIFFGATVALVPLGYSLYLALLDQNRFGEGKATWPMFCASLCVTLAFTISITRYRLMQLDQIVSSGFAYVAISVLAAVVYYGLEDFPAWRFPWDIESGDPADLRRGRYVMLDASARRRFGPSSARAISSSRG